MKKGKRMLTIVGMLLIAIFSFATTVYANPFDNNSNYVKIGADEQVAEYLDLNSVSCTRYDPPYYALKATVVMWSYTNDTYSIFSDTYLYNYNTKHVIDYCNEMSVYSSNGSLLSHTYEQQPSEVYRDTNGGLLANLIFAKYYGQSFY